MKLTRYAASSILSDGSGNTMFVDGDNARIELRRLYRTLRTAGAGLYVAHSSVYDLAFAMSLATTMVTFVAADDTTYVTQVTCV